MPYMNTDILPVWSSEIPESHCQPAAGVFLGGSEHRVLSSPRVSLSTMRTILDVSVLRDLLGPSEMPDSTNAPCSLQGPWVRQTDLVLHRWPPRNPSGSLEKLTRGFCLSPRLKELIFPGMKMTHFIPHETLSL